jgi:hypothetical protein
MGFWDDEATSDTTYLRARYYCVVCEKFFELSPIAPLRCPTCFTDARNIIGPIPAKEYDLNKLIRENKRKYGHAQRR